jgi:hypothetical protein
VLESKRVGIAVDNEKQMERCFIMRYDIQSKKYSKIPVFSNVNDKKEKEWDNARKAAKEGNLVVYSADSSKPERIVVSQNGRLGLTDVYMRAETSEQKRSEVKAPNVFKQGYYLFTRQHKEKMQEFEEKRDKTAASVDFWKKTNDQRLKQLKNQAADKEKKEYENAGFEKKFGKPKKEFDIEKKTFKARGVKAETNGLPEQQKEVVREIREKSLRSKEELFNVVKNKEQEIAKYSVHATNIIVDKTVKKALTGDHIGVQNDEGKIEYLRGDKFVEHITNEENRENFNEQIKTTVENKQEADKNVNTENIPDVEQQVQGLVDNKALEETFTQVVPSKTQEQMKLSMDVLEKIAGLDSIKSSYKAPQEDSLIQKLKENNTSILDNNKDVDAFMKQAYHASQMVKQLEGNEALLKDAKEKGLINDQDLKFAKSLGGVFNLYENGLKIKESLVSGEGYINPDMRHIAVGTVLTGRMIENEIEKGKIFKGTMLDTIHDDKIQVGLVTAFANSQESKDLLKNNKNLKDIAKKMDDKSLDEMVMSVANRVSSKGKSKKEKALATESIQQTKEKKTNKVLGS